MGVTAPFINQAFYRDVPNGRLSLYNPLWRAWFPVVPVTAWQQALGCNGLMSDGRFYDPAYQLMAGAGVATFRIELDWNSVDINTGQISASYAPTFQKQLTACKKYNLQPLILLHAPQGNFCPAKAFTARLSKPYVSGSPNISLDLTSLTNSATLADFVMHKTGIDGNQAWGISAPTSCAFLFTSSDGTGNFTISQPIQASLNVGYTMPCRRQLYRPFWPNFVDGGIEYQDTLSGWTAFCEEAGRFIRAYWGILAGHPLGFNHSVTGRFIPVCFEVWNEFTNESAGLNANGFYTFPGQPLPVALPPNYTYGAIWRDMNASAVNGSKNTASNLYGCLTFNGFSNQKFQYGNQNLPPGETGLSWHPYPPLRKFYPGMKAVGGGGWPAGSRVVDVNGNNMGIPPTVGNYNNPTYFIPTFYSAASHWWLKAGDTETLARNLNPVPPPELIFGQPSGLLVPTLNPDGSSAGPVAPIISEFGIQPNDLMTALGLGPPGGYSKADNQRIKMKTAISAWCLYPAYGVRALYMFSAQYGNSDSGWGLMDPAFFTAVAANNYQPLPDNTPYTSEVFRVLKNLSTIMVAQGGVVGTLRTNILPTQISDTHNHIQWAGNPANPINQPPLYDRDCVIICAYQLDGARMMLLMWVGTENVANDYSPGNPSADRLLLPEEDFTITFKNFNVSQLAVSGLDPRTNAPSLTTVKPNSNDATLADVHVWLTDYPRAFLFDDSQPLGGGGGGLGSGPYDIPGYQPGNYQPSGQTTGGSMGGGSAVSSYDIPGYQPGDYQPGATLQQMGGTGPYDIPGYQPGDYQPGGGRGITPPTLLTEVLSTDVTFIQCVTGSTEQDGQTLNNVSAVRKGAFVAVWARYMVSDGLLQILNGPVTTITTQMIASAAPTITVFNSLGQPLTDFTAVSPSFFDMMQQSQVETSFMLDTNDAGFVEGERYTIVFTSWLEASFDGSVQRKVNALTLDIIPLLAT